MVIIRRLKGSAGKLVRSVTALSTRERDYLIREISQVKGLMPLIMKRRNREPWSTEDKSQVTEHLKRLTRISPYLAVLAMPGGFLVLPVLAWWLDRRRNRGRVRSSGSA